MLKINHRPRYKIPIRVILRFAGFCPAFTLLLAFFLLPLPALAHTTDRGSSISPTAGPRFSVNAGFNTRYRSGNWIPVQVTLRNDSSDFTGTISINSPNMQNSYGGSVSASSYQVPISLPNGSQKQVTIYVPVYGSTQGITVSLLNSNGNTVSTQTSVLQPLNAGDIFVGILSDSSTGFGPLSGFTLPNAGSLLITDFLNASTMPDNAAVLRNFDLIVLDNFTTSTLSAKQLAALQTWVNVGGSLIAAGGPEWQRTLTPLPTSLLPVTIHGTATLLPGTHLLPVGSPAAQTSGGAAQAPVTISKGTATAVGETILASGRTPLIVQANFGQGTVCYVALDPTLEPVVGWTGASALWKGLLLRSLGDGMLASSFGSAVGSPGQPGSLTNLLQSFLPNSLPSPWILAVLLIGYLLILGPVRTIIVRWRKRRDWSWRIVLSSVVVFSLVTYGLALQQKGTSVVSNRITIMQLSQGGSVAHVMTYLGVFVPNQGNYHVHISGDELVQPSPDQNYQFGGPGISNSNQAQNTTITPAQDGTDVNLQGVDIWTLRSIVSEQDTQVTGGIVSHLALQNGTLTGTVTNTLATSLSDVYVLMPNSYVNIGDLAAGATKPINLQLNTTSTNSGTLLAAQIASANGLQGGNFDSSQIHTEQQRHIAILSALDGIYGGFACGGGAPCPVAIAKRGLVLAPGGSYSVYYSGPLGQLSNSSDPLLIAGAPATLIGWASPNSDVTINGSNTTGVDETLIQAPLDVNYSGTLNLPANLLNGQVIDAEGSNVQSPAPGYYTLTKGSVTFEFFLPDVTHLRSGNLILAEPGNVTQIANQSGSGPFNDGSQNALLYNWHTQGWDTITFEVQTFTTADIGSYVGPGGRVLIQFGNNQDAPSGTTVFGKPSLNLQGVVGQ